MTLVKIFHPIFNDSSIFIEKRTGNESSGTLNHEIQNENHHQHASNKIMLSPNKNFVTSHFRLEQFFGDKNRESGKGNTDIKMFLTQNQGKSMHHTGTECNHSNASSDTENLPFAIDLNHWIQIYGSPVGQLWNKLDGKQVWIVAFQAHILAFIDFLESNLEDQETNIPGKLKSQMRYGQCTYQVLAFEYQSNTFQESTKVASHPEETSDDPSEITIDSLNTRFTHETNDTSQDLLISQPCKYIASQSVEIPEGLGKLLSIWEIHSGIALHFENGFAIATLSRDDRKDRRLRSSVAALENNDDLPIHMSVNSWIPFQKCYMDCTTGVTKSKDIILFCGYRRNNIFTVDMFHMQQRRFLGNIRFQDRYAREIQKTTFFQCTSNPDLSLVIIDENNRLFVIHVHDCFVPVISLPIQCEKFNEETRTNVDIQLDMHSNYETNKTNKSKDNEVETEEGANDEGELNDEHDEDAENGSGEEYDDEEENHDATSDEEQEFGTKWDSKLKIPHHADALVITQNFIQNRLSDPNSLYNIVNRPERDVMGIEFHTFSPNDDKDFSNYITEYNVSLSSLRISFKLQDRARVAISSNGNIILLWKEVLIILDMNFSKLYIHIDPDMKELVTYESNQHRDIYLSTTSGDLFTVFPNTSVESIIEDLITYNNARLSFHLCQLNNWKSEFLLLQSLRDALSNRDTEIVRLSLETMPSEYHFKALCICMSYLQECSKSHFRNKLSTILLQNATDALKGLRYSNDASADEDILLQYLRNKSQEKGYQAKFFSLNYEKLVNFLPDVTFPFRKFLISLIADLRLLQSPPQESEDRRSSATSNNILKENPLESLQSYWMNPSISPTKNSVNMDTLQSDESFIDAAYNDKIASFLSILSLNGVSVKYSDFKDRVRVAAIQRLHANTIPFVEKLLQNIEEDSIEIFNQILLETHDRAIRKQLHIHLESHLNDDVTRLIKESELLENFYPQPEDLVFSLKELSNWKLEKDILLFERNYGNVSPQAALKVLCERNDLKTLERYIHKTHVKEINRFLEECNSDVFFLAWIEEVLSCRNMFITSDLGHITRVRSSSGQLWSVNEQETTVLPAFKLKSDDIFTVGLSEYQSYILNVAIEYGFHLFFLAYASYFNIDARTQLHNEDSEESSLFTAFNLDIDQYHDFFNHWRGRLLGTQEILHHRLFQNPQLINDSTSQSFISAKMFLEMESVSVPQSSRYISPEGAINWISEDDNTSLGLEYYLLRGRYADSKKLIQELGPVSTEVVNTLRSVALSNLNNKTVLFTCLILIVEIEMDRNIVLEIEVASRLSQSLSQWNVSRILMQSDPQETLNDIIQMTKELIQNSMNWFDAWRNVQLQSPWNLSMVFSEQQLKCELLEPVIQFAKENNWIPMLYEIDHLPIEHVEEILKEIQSDALKKHLMFAIMNESEHTSTSSGLSGNRKSLSIIRDLLCNENSSQNLIARECLQRSVDEKDSLLSICAFMLDPTLYSECQASYVACKSQGIPYTSFNEILQEYLMSDCFIICESYRIFNASSPIRYLFEFICVFNKGMYSKLKQFAKLIYCALQTHTDAAACIHLLKNHFAPQIPTTYGRSLLLSIMHQCEISEKFVPEFETLYKVDQVIHSGEEYSVMFELSEVNIFIARPIDIVDELSTQKMFDTARTISFIFGMKNTLEDITRREATHMALTLKQSKLWSTSQERRLVWNKLSRLFLKYEFRQSHAAIFFLNHLAESDVSSLPIEDIIYLLKVILSWFDGTTSNTTLGRARPIRSQDDLSLLQGLIKILELESEIHNESQDIRQRIFPQFMIQWVCSTFLPTYTPTTFEEQNWETYVGDLIDELLFRGDFVNASKLSNHFNVNPHVVEIASTALGLVRKELDPMHIPLWIQENIIDSDKKDFSTKTFLEKLLHTCDNVSRSRGIRRFCRTISLDHDICEIANISIQQLQKGNVDSILEKLILQGKPCWRLASRFVELHTIPQRVSSEICARIIAEQLKIAICQVDDLKTSQKDSKKFDILRLDSLEKYNELVSICKDGVQLGNKLLTYINEEIDKEYQEEFQVELLIRASWSFENGTNLGGMGEKQIQFIYDILMSKLIEKEKFVHMIKLFVNLRKDLNMATLFDTLIKLDKFELLLNYNGYEDSQSDLKMALIDYLRQYSTSQEHEERLLGVYLRFSLCKELGDALLKRAKNFLQQLVPSLEVPNPSQKKRNTFCDQLERVKEHFLNAADALRLGQCFRSVLDCEHMMQLIEYQEKLIQKGNFPVILNITREQAMQFMIYSNDFIGAFTIANVHDLNRSKHWTTVIWNKVILQGELEYFLVYREYLPADEKMYREIIKLYKKSDQDDSNIAENMRLFISLHPNYRDQAQFFESISSNWSKLAYRVLDKKR